MDVDTGMVKEANQPRGTYSTAQKMRAAVSSRFARNYNRGLAPWTENPVVPGKFTGNPSHSTRVSQYMISLRRRKTRKGEQVISAKAMDEGVLQRLVEYNMSFDDSPHVEFLSSVPRKKLEKNPHLWAGFYLRCMLTLLYITAFLCLLRFDEALRIRWEDIRFERWVSPAGIVYPRIVLNLPFRKTHQNGGE